MPNREKPSVGKALQSSEMMRNSLGWNYKSGALSTWISVRISSDMGMRSTN